MAIAGGSGIQQSVPMDRNKELLALYFSKVVATPTITTPTDVDDEEIEINDNTDLVAGEAINFYERNRHSQCVIVSSTATTVTVDPPLDYAYSTEAIVEAGPWNMAVDGSTTPQVFSIRAPLLASYSIVSLRFSMLDQSDMDDALFGGRPALSLGRGLVIQFANGFRKNLAVIYNNTGFREYGFNSKYTDKAPSGYYGYGGEAVGPFTYGTNVRLVGATADKFSVIVRANLSALDNLNFNAGGHLV